MKKTKLQVSGRISNAMWLRGFWPDNLPEDLDIEMEACRKFYEFCIQMVDAETEGRMATLKPRPAQQRWQQFENFGKSSLKELQKIVGKSDASEAKGCFDVMVPRTLYYRLKKMAEDGQIKD